MQTPLDDAVIDQIRQSGVDLNRLVLIDGVPHLLDIRFRMLQNNELARAMGFHGDESQYEFTGTVGQITKQIGNAVPVNIAAALVKAALSPTANQTNPAGATAP